MAEKDSAADLGGSSKYSNERNGCEGFRAVLSFPSGTGSTTRMGTPFKLRGVGFWSKGATLCFGALSFRGNPITFED